MAVTFTDLIIDARDPRALAAFWQRVLDWEITDEDEDGVTLSPPEPGPPAITFLPVPEPKTVKNRLHIDVRPAAGSDQDTELERLLGIGARKADIGQGEQTWVVLADPEGNEFCLLRTPAGG
jgi:hypothetical protein